MLTFVLFMFIYTESKREKSLWLLTQNFVKLFLCSDVSREIFCILFLSRAIRLSLIWLILVFLSSRWIWLHLTVLQWPCLVTPTTPLLWEVIDLTIIIFALQSYLGVDSLKLFWYVSAAKIRRLYDIANVFSSMNLIEKVCPFRNAHLLVCGETTIKK